MKLSQLWMVTLGPPFQGVPSSCPMTVSQEGTGAARTGVAGTGAARTTPAGASEEGTPAPRTIPAGAPAAASEVVTADAAGGCPIWAFWMIRFISAMKVF